MEKEALTPTSPSQDERIMAAISHGAILLPMTGAIVPIIVWITQREKSRYVAFQALQAITYHIVLILTWFIGMACYIGSFFSIFAGFPLADSLNREWLAGVFSFFPFLVFGGVLCGGLFLVCYGLVAAGLVLMGKDFRYIVIGRFLERYLQRS